MNDFDELERRYSGPIPKPLADAAWAGGAPKLRVRQAAVNLRFWRDQARAAIRVIRAASAPTRQAAGREDLRYAWTHYRGAWQELKQARACAATVDGFRHLHALLRHAAE